MELTGRIATDLQTRWTFSQIDNFFAAAGVSTDGFEWGGSKKVYVEDILKHNTADTILKIAAELGIVANGASIQPLTPPKNWQDPKPFRLFISHISKDKLIATRLRDALKSYNVAAFVAHEDIEPTLPWQEEIERGLRTMDAMVAVHTPGFSLSNWTQQEVGYALGRGVPVISFKYGEDPTGFIQKHQALPRRGKTAEIVAEEIANLLRDDRRTAERFKAAEDAWECPF